MQRAAKAREAILIRQHNERAWLAWHIAGLQRSKKLPDLARLQHKEPRRPQTWQEQLAIAHMWAARGAGIITYPDKTVN